MLDYDLVTSTARYRLPTQDDIPAFVRLVKRFYAERSQAHRVTAESVTRTYLELLRHPERGSIFLFERGESLVGYCLLLVSWSNEHGGDIVTIDEIYIAPDHRGGGIARDFLGLLSQVAPRGTRAIRIRAPSKDRNAARFCTKTGFTPSGDGIMIKELKGS